jgi:hypothetical protein
MTTQNAMHEHAQRLPSRLQFRLGAKRWNDVQSNRFSSVRCARNHTDRQGRQCEKRGRNSFGDQQVNLWPHRDVGNRKHGEPNPLVGSQRARKFKEGLRPKFTDLRVP